MALSGRWTRSQLRAAVRVELLDPTGRWWTDTELNQYLDDWQQDLQDSLEAIWTTQELTVTAGDSLTWNTAEGTWETTEGTWETAGEVGGTLSEQIQVPSGMQRLDAVCWDGVRLVGKSLDEMNMMQSDWRNETAGTPRVVYQPSPDIIAFWPPPATAGEVVLEYPVRESFVNDSSTMLAPGWMRYSAIDYCCWRAYSRPGPNQSLKRASRRKGKYARQLKFFRLLVDNFCPTYTPSIKPSTNYEARIVLGRS